jgi:hypothetical protein
MSLYTSCDSGRKTPRVGSRGRLHFAFDTESIMAGKIDARLKELDIILPSPPAPVAR